MLASAAHFSPTIISILVYATATAMGALFIWIGKSLAKIAKRQSAIHDQVMGVSEIGYPSMRDQFTEIREHLCKQDMTLEKLEHEVQDNSGSSLKDAVRKINKDINEIRNSNSKSFDELNKKFDNIEQKFESHLSSTKL
jgi:predicted  nucleic acid-binding Zn-ribbon protein